MGLLARDSEDAARTGLAQVTSVESLELQEEITAQISCPVMEGVGSWRLCPGCPLEMWEVAVGPIVSWEMAVDFPLEPYLLTFYHCSHLHILADLELASALEMRCERLRRHRS